MKVTLLPCDKKNLNGRFYAKEEMTQAVAKLAGKPLLVMLASSELSVGDVINPSFNQSLGHVKDVEVEESTVVGVFEPLPAYSHMTEMVQSGKMVLRLGGTGVVTCSGEVIDYTPTMVTITTSQEDSFLSRDGEMVNTTDLKSVGE